MNRRFDFAGAHQHQALSYAPARLHGHNYQVWVEVAGQLNPETGLLVERGAVDEAAACALAPFDYQDLTTALAPQAPTAANLARALWAGLVGTLPRSATLHTIDLREEAGAGVRVAASGLSYISPGEFSAAHRTHAPGLSEAENLALYGICDNPAGHGHNYQVEVHHPQVAVVPAEVWAEFDHRNLSVDIPDLLGRNVVTEAIAELLARRVPGAERVRVWETPGFFAEYWPAAENYRLGRHYRFSAAHRLGEPTLSDATNLRRYGRCGKAGQHGHTFGVEITVLGTLDPATGAAFDLGRLDQAARAVLAPLDQADLDQVAPGRPRNQGPNTAERLALDLWQQLSIELGRALDSVSVSETPESVSRVTEVRHG